MSYESGQIPIAVCSGDWTKLPDAGVFLPNGTQVMVKIACEAGEFGPGISVPALKLSIADSLLPKMFNQWERPNLTIPDLTKEGADIPSIEKRSYGSHPLSGVPLIASGVLVRKGAGFEWRWFTNEMDAKDHWDRLPHQIDDLRSGNDSSGSVSRLAGLFGGSAKVVVKKRVPKI